MRRSPRAAKRVGTRSRHRAAQRTPALAAGNLRRLRSLGLRSNRLTCLPAEVGDLTELEALYLTDNALRQLPRSVGRLRRLRKLQAASNRLEALPDELALLPELVRPS